MKYDIMENGNLVHKSPIIGSWYCHMETITMGDESWDRSGTIAQYEDEGFWVDEDGESVDSLVSEYWPDYLVLQD